jgi:hypothetical protein
MSEQKRFLVTFDSAQGGPLKVEQIGESGELTEVELAGFLRLLNPGAAAAVPAQQIVINIYGGAAPVVEQLPAPPKPSAMLYTDDIPATKLHRTKPRQDE